MVTRYRIEKPMRAAMQPHRARIWNLPRVGNVCSRVAMVSVELGPGCERGLIRVRS
jgi:hypothetical protein